MHEAKPTDLLPFRLKAAASAILNARAARRGAPQVANVLELTERVNPREFEAVVEEARAALVAAEAADRAEPPKPRPRGPLCMQDAAALGLDLGVASVIIFAFGHDRRPHKAYWTAKGASDELASAVASAELAERE